MNKVILIGRLTKDPEIAQTESGISYCKFSIAVSRDYSNSDGEKETDFFNITVWRTKAENCAKFLNKGKLVGIVGNLQNRSYEDKDGIKRSVTDVIANDVEFLSPKDKNEATTSKENTEVVRKERPKLEEMNDDSLLPF